MLQRRWLQIQASEVASRRQDFSHLAQGIDWWASRRLLAHGKLAADEAGALRTVLAGNVVTEEVAAKWTQSPSCKHSGARLEDRLHMFYVLPLISIL